MPVKVVDIVAGGGVAGGTAGGDGVELALMYVAVMVIGPALFPPTRSSPRAVPGGMLAPITVGEQVMMRVVVAAIAVQPERLVPGAIGVLENTVPAGLVIVIVKTAEVPGDGGGPTTGGTGVRGDWVA